MKAKAYVNIALVILCFVLSAARANPTLKQAAHPAGVNGAKDLTAADRDLATRLGFDPKALLIVKNDLNADLSLGPTRPFLTEQERSDPAYKRRQVKLPEDLANFKNIAIKYPVLKPVVDACLERANPPRIDHSMNEAALKEILSHGTAVPDFLKMFQSQNTPSKPMKTIDVQYNAGAIGQGGVESVNRQLNGLNYNLTRILNRATSRVFKTKAEALAFLAANGTPVSLESLAEVKADSFEAIYPVDWQTDFQTPADQLIFVRQANLRNFYANKSAAEYAAMEVQGMRQLASTSAPFLARQQEKVLFLPENAIVEKLSNKRWKICTPARFIATATRRSALLVKIGDESFAQTLADYNINYLRQLKPVNDELVKALERWNKAYGVILVEPETNGPLIKFKTLPDNLDSLMMEIRQLSDQSLNADENVNAASARTAAAALRADHCVRLQLIGKTAVVPRN